MIDMHSHILFGVDDGAKELNDSLELIRAEVSKGVSHIILTPHFKKRIGEAESEKVYENYMVLKDVVRRESLNIELFLGNEIYIGSKYFDVLEDNSFYTLANSNYVLIEFGLSNTLENIAEICYEFRLREYIPIIAHVERYDYLYSNKYLIKDVLEEGAHLQVNASSIINRDNRERCKFVNFLLNNELVSFIASDLHNLDSRGFYLDQAYSLVKKTYGEEYADRIFKLNQQNIISNKCFDSPCFLNSTGGFLSKIFKIKKY